MMVYHIVVYSLSFKCGFQVIELVKVFVKEFENWVVLCT